MINYEIMLARQDVNVMGEYLDYTIYEVSEFYGNNFYSFFEFRIQQYVLQETLIL